MLMISHKRRRVVEQHLVKTKTKCVSLVKGTAVSPDLQLAMKKGMMIAKSELADIHQRN